MDHHKLEDIVDGYVHYFYSMYPSNHIHLYNQPLLIYLFLHCCLSGSCLFSIFLIYWSRSDFFYSFLNIILKWLIQCCSVIINPFDQGSLIISAFSILQFFLKGLLHLGLNRINGLSWLWVLGIHSCVP